MANPQKENGYTAIANEIMDALMSYGIPNEKMRVLLCVLRMTYGFNRKEVEISNNKISKMTGLKRQNVVRAISWLESNKILSRILLDSKRVKSLKFNKHYDKWVPFEKRVPRIKLDSKTRILLDSNAVSLPIIVKTKENNVVPYQKIVDFLNQKTGKNFKANSKETRRHIKARWQDGFTLKDFEKVIEVKSAKWLSDPKMMDFLRPQTLFGNKFESYLNEKADCRVEDDFYKKLGS